jgi:hypothetical protein
LLAVDAPKTGQSRKQGRLARNLRRRHASDEKGAIAPAAVNRCSLTKANILIFWVSRRVQKTVRLGTNSAF